ncbi:zf-HC2 domain-containing protein [Actinoplanes sp. NPDC049599]|uniref:zf-HC2 domain-containing protein n=1 Tax=Actinoplanes sp. NPDC049599 TaxID=3363903 RepID=UPI0037BAB335
MTADHDELRRLLGGYLLGGLDDTDTDRLDAHLLSCDECRAELDRLAPVPELLRSLEHALPVTVTAGTRPSPARIESLLARMRAEKSRNRRRSTGRRLAVAAAVTLVVAGGVGVIITRDDAPPPGPPPTAAPSQPVVTAVFEASDGSGITGQAVLTGKTWGVSVDLTMSKLPGRGPFVCKVGKADGTQEQAAIWGPTPSGNAKVTGASSIQLRNVSTVAVADHDGHVLGTAHLN